MNQRATGFRFYEPRVLSVDFAFASSTVYRLNKAVGIYVSKLIRRLENLKNKLILERGRMNFALQFLIWPTIYKIIDQCIRAGLLVTAVIIIFSPLASAKIKHAYSRKEPGSTETKICSAT
jgi:hypothetical protein